MSRRLRTSLVAASAIAHGIPARERIDSLPALTFSPTRARNHKAFNLVEVIIALFLLSFAALSVLSMTQTGFVAQKRNQQIAKGNLVIQSVMADIRLWAADISHYKSNWSSYNGTFTPTGYPDYKVRVRALAAGRPIDSPCAELETQWEPTTRGKRTMPNAVIPVEVTVFWSDSPLDSVKAITYVGEPKRDITNLQFEVDGPTPKALAMNDQCDYSIKAKDQNGRYLDNLMFQWVPDIRYVSPTKNAKRDGREFEMERDQIVALPDVPAPLPPALSPVTCYARYAGAYLDASAQGVELP